MRGGGSIYRVPAAEGGGGGGGNTPTLVQHVGSTVNDNNGITGNGFKITPPNSVLAANCGVLEIEYPYSASRTVAITDTSGDTWTIAGAPTTDAANMALAIYVCSNMTAGARTITVTLDAAVKPFGYKFTEFYNVATSSPVDGTHGTASVASPNVSAGSFTPSTNNDANGGHLIYWATRSNDHIGTNTANGASNIAPTASGSLLDADNTSTIPGASAYFVQATNGAINPGFTITQSSGTNFVCAAVALKAANAGTAPVAGIRIVRLLHTNIVASTTLHLPSDGNLLLAFMSAGSNLNAISSVTDSNSQTYTNPGAAGESQCFYKQNATPANNLKVTLNGASTGTNWSVRLYDITGAATSSFDGVGGLNGATPSSNPFNNAPNVTPTTNGRGLAIATVGLGIGPLIALASGAPAGGVLDSILFTGQNDFDMMDNADGVAHVYYSSNAAQTWNWTMSPAAFSQTAVGTAVCFK